MFITGCTQIDPKGDRSILSNERFPAPTALTDADIKWFRSFGVSWIHSENGSPALVLPDLTLEEQVKLHGKNDEARLVLDRFERVFTTFAVYGSLTSGIYPIDSKAILGKTPAGLPAIEKFELTQTHMNLMRRAWWREGFIDFKYPYGSYRYYEADMAIKLGEKVPRNSQTGVYELSQLTREKYQKLHNELLFAVLVFVKFAEIEPGEYQLPIDGWKSSLFRLSPPTKQQVDSYMMRAIELKILFSKGKGDKVLDWLKLNREFSKIIG